MDVEIELDRRAYIGAVVVAVAAIIVLYLFAGGTMTGDGLEGMGDGSGDADGAVSELMLADADVPEGLTVQDERPISVEDIENEAARDIFEGGYFTYWGDALQQEGVQQTVFVTDPDAADADEVLGVGDYLSGFDWEEQDVTVDADMDTESVWFDPENEMYFVYISVENRHAELVVTDRDMDLEDVTELASAAAGRL